MKNPTNIKQGKSAFSFPYHYLILLFFAFFLSNHLVAQEVLPKSERAKIICPEISKLAESVTLARENQMPESRTLEIINSTMKLEQGEHQVINQMVNYIYSHPEKPIYENTIYVLLECYKHVD